jgi:hypothetical protein
MNLDLRPLTLGELLDRSFGLYRRHFFLFVGLMAVPSVFALLFGVFGQILPEVFKAQVGPVPDPNPATMALLFGLGALGFVVLMFAYWIAYMVTLGATTVAVSELYVGRTATIASAYGQVREHVGRLLLLALLVALRLLGIFAALMVAVIAFGLVAVVVLGENRALGVALVMLATFAAMLFCGLFSLRYALSVPALVLEHAKASESIRRSVLLTRGNFWRTAVLMIFALIITYAAMALFQGPFLVAGAMAATGSSAALWLNVAGAVTGAVGGAICGPLMVIALALLYYDLRIRKEGLDLQIMMDNLDPHPESPVPAPVL